MISIELNRLLAEIRSIPLDESLSDDALGALSHIYIAVYNMIAEDGTDDEYGDRKEYEAALDTLCDLCRTRCERTPTAAESMSGTIYRLLRGPMRPADTERLVECRRWISEIVADGEQDGWNGIPVRDALDRMALLYDAADFMPDPDRDSRLERLVALAGEQLLPELAGKTFLTTADCRALARLYDLTVWGPGMPDARTIDTIAGLARQIIDDALSESRLWGLAILTDLACRRTSAALETEYFAYSA